MSNGTLRFIVFLALFLLINIVLGIGFLSKLCEIAGRISISIILALMLQCLILEKLEG